MIKLSTWGSDLGHGSQAKVGTLAVENWEEYVMLNKSANISLSKLQVDSQPHELSEHVTMGYGLTFCSVMQWSAKSGNGGTFAFTAESQTCHTWTMRISLP